MQLLRISKLKYIPNIIKVSKSIQPSKCTHRKNSNENNLFKCFLTFLKK